MKSRTLIPTLARSQWSARRQLAIILRDCSPSMQGQKAIDAEAASNDLITELARPRNKGTFDIAVIDFHSDARLVQGATPAEQALGSLPSMHCDGSTDITKALELAERVVISLDSSERARSVVLLLSDGAHNGGGDPVQIADRLKALADIVSVAFGDDADEDLLRRCATSGQHFYQCTDGTALRCFFQEVGTTLSTAMHSQANPTLLLGHMQTGQSAL